MGRLHVVTIPHRLDFLIVKPKTSSYDIGNFLHRTVPNLKAFLMSDKTNAISTVEKSAHDVDAKQVLQQHPLADAIDRYLHCTRDIKFAARVFITAANEVMQKQSETLKEDFHKAEILMESSDSGNRAHGVKLAFAASRTAKRLIFSNLPAQLESSLFISLFSSFDMFTGELITALHLKKPALFDRLNRTVPLSTILAAVSIDDLKANVLNEEIEGFRRKSYPEQFDYLEAAFGLSLKKFPRWSDFVEATQRRNLFTHCGGVVSEQYRTVCEREGVPLKEIAPVGDRLILGPKYFLPTCELLHEVALKLGHTLWRKVLPEDLKAADIHLNSVVYDALSLEQWERAEIAGEFFAHQKTFSNDLYRRMAAVNYAIALKRQKKIEAMKSALSVHDWSASIPEFRLAEAILLDETENAIAIMKMIGIKGQLLEEHSYYSWPLFQEFCQQLEFQQTYESIYGYPFVHKVQTEARQELSALEDQKELEDQQSATEFLQDETDKN